MAEPKSLLKPYYWMINLALEAPLVACLWWILVDKSLREFSADWKIGVTLFFLVWTIYLADRIFDRGLKLPNQPERKRFANQHSLGLTCLLVFAVISSLWFAWTSVSRDILWQAVTVAGLTLGYFAMCRIGNLRWKFPVKESLIGICFAMAIGIPYQNQLIMQTSLCLFIFALLCTANCLLISRAESDFDQQDDPNAWFATHSQFKFRYVWLSIFLLIELILYFHQLPLSVLIALSMATFLLAIVDWLSIEHPIATQSVDTCLWIGALSGLLLT